ncbi:MAG: serine hydrolase domain-containing protein [Acidimicrobiales bacterium]
MRSTTFRSATVALAVVITATTAACNSGSTNTVERSDATSSTVPTSGSAETSPSTSQSTTPGAPETSVAVADPINTLTPLPSQPDGVPFPTDRWPEGTIPAGVDVDRLAETIESAFGSNKGSYGQIDAVLVVQGGEIVLERYDDSYPPQQPHDSWSVAKSVTHAVLGILVRDTLLDYDAPAAIQEWAEDERAEITPEQLARMSSGLEWNERFDAIQLVGSAAGIDAAAQQSERPLVADVGSVFNYSTGSTAVNGRIIGDLVGTGDEFRDWIGGELFDPLGITSAELISDGNGYWVAGYGANMVARDFARFGLLYLRDGVWDGDRILPEGWVNDARTPSDTNSEYGAGFWIGLNGPDTFSAEGFRGQKVVIAPDSDLVVVVLSNNLNSDRSTAFASTIVNLFRRQ